MLRLPSSRALAGALCAVFGMPTLAAAQGPAGARSFCLPGSTEQCFAFAISDGASGFEVWLRNLSPWGDDVANPFAIRQLAVRRVNAPTPGGLRTDLSAGFSNANVTTTDGALRGGAGLDENTSAAAFPAVRTFDYRMAGSYGLLGCRWPSASLLAVTGYVGITCAERGLDGWLRIAFGARVWSEEPLAASFVWRPASIADVAVQVAGCTTYRGAASGVTDAVPGSVLCESTPYTESVVPEPGAVWLVGVGLAGAWAAARARRGAPA